MPAVQHAACRPKLRKNPDCECLAKLDSIVRAVGRVDFPNAAGSSILNMRQSSR